MSSNSLQLGGDFQSNGVTFALLPTNIVLSEFGVGLIVRPNVQSYPFNVAQILL